MENITFNIHDLMVLLGLIASIWAVYKIIKELSEPRKALEAKVDALERWHKEDHQRIKDNSELQTYIFKCVYQLIRHEATGNGTEDFVELLKDLDDKVRF